MKKIIFASLALIAFSTSNLAIAGGDITMMVGKWKWEKFVISVEKCPTTEVCAKVVSGPKNVGMQIIKTKLKPMDGNFVGKVAHPQTGDTYNSKLTMVNADTWKLDGCTDANVCASGSFTRIK
ncbi:MAG: DUF2147 domain-containing protein [Gammaproteobacteria bacterium]